MTGEPCGKWMPRRQTTCARLPGHGGPCATPEAMQSQRRRAAARVLIHGRSVNPDIKARWTRAYKLQRYGLSQEQFDGLLEAQQRACGMCRTPFGVDKPICIDHDHACCPDEKSSCGKCVRGLLCMPCNTALGQIERKYELARTYLDSLPGHVIVRVEHAA